ncbi:MAG: hypothetical protein QM743_05510 [Chitinophagaceae bacterium]
MKNINLTDGDTSIHRFILWNDAACRGCKEKCVSWLSDHPTGKACIIVPYSDKILVDQLPDTQYWVDTFNKIGRYFYGVHNMGLIQVRSGKVVAIKDFPVSEINTLKTELAK